MRENMTKRITKEITVNERVVNERMVNDNMINGNIIGAKELRSPVLRRAEARRRRQLRRRLVKFAFVFAAITLFAAGTLSVRSFAGTKGRDEVRTKFYKSIIIEKGDTINSIAAKNISPEYSTRREYIAEVVQLNHISEADKISAGSHLIVPYYSE